MIIEQLGGMRVIAGEADHGLLTFVAANFRNRDALELGLDGHGRPPWAGRRYTANAKPNRYGSRDAFPEGLGKNT
jgi:hypothetical protein